MKSNVKPGPVKGKAPRGRPRSQDARRAILHAAHRLIDEGGLGAVTMEAVAARAGVGKPTVYRSWPNRHALAMAALMESEAPTSATSGRRSPLAQLREQLEQIALRFGTSSGRHIASLLAAAEGDSELAKAFRTHFVLARRAEGRSFLEAAQSKNQLPKDLEVEVVLDALYGAIFFRLLVGHAGLDQQFVRALVDNVLLKLSKPT